MISYAEKGEVDVPEALHHVIGRGIARSSFFGRWGPGGFPESLGDDSGGGRKTVLCLGPYTHFHL